MGPLPEPKRDFFQCVGVHGNICVEEYQNVAGGHPGAGIACLGRSTIGLLPHIMSAKFPAGGGNLTRSKPGTIIDDQHLRRTAGTRRECTQT